MFESTKYILEESDHTYVDHKYDDVAPMIVRSLRDANSTENAREICIMQRYQFSSSLQRMSVIVSAKGSNDYRAYTKGSPEMIISLSKTETVPSDVTLALEQYTRQGYRVIAIGRREVICEGEREEVIF